MGGEYPSGREWNFYQDAVSARYVADHWPTPIVFVGFEAGRDVLTGKGLRRLGRSPLRRAYELYNGLADRSSWDQLTVLVAARKEQGVRQGLWRLVPGKNLVATDGSNRWQTGGAQPHEYLLPTVSPAAYSRMIEPLMLDAGQKKRLP